MVLEFEQIEALCKDRDLFGRVVTQVKYTPQEAALIGAAYMQIFKRQIVQTCGNCVGDALSELVALYRKNPEKMKDQNACKYQLRAGMLIRLNFGDNVYYSNANLTDKVAEEYILEKPSRLSNFEKYPESIIEKIENGKAAEAEGEVPAEEPTPEVPAPETEEPTPTPEETPVEEAPEPEEPTTGKEEPADETPAVKRAKTTAKTAKTTAKTAKTTKK